MRGKQMNKEKTFNFGVIPEYDKIPSVEKEKWFQEQNKKMFPLFLIK
jgi:hypothetical protein